MCNPGNYSPFSLSWKDRIIKKLMEDSFSEKLEVCHAINTEKNGLSETGISYEHP